MGKYVMLVGGPGLQNGGNEWPPLIGYDYWLAGKPSDFMGTNGEPLINSSYTVTVSGGMAYFGDTGHFTGMNLTGVCFAMIDNNGGLSNVGYYEIYSNTDDEVTCNATSVSGYATLSNGDTISVIIGGSGLEDPIAGETAIENANDILFAHIAPYNTVEVLSNYSEQFTGSPTLDCDGSSLCPVTYIGCIQDNSVVDNNFVEAIEYNDMPFLEGTGVNDQFTISGVCISFRGFRVEADTGNRVLLADANASQCTIENCKVVQLGTGTSDDSAITVTKNGIIKHCYVITNTTQTGVSGAAISASAQAAVLNNFVIASQMGINLTGNYARVICRNNVVVGNDANVGIYNPISTNSRGGDISFNSVYNFTTGIEISGTLQTDDDQTNISNNIIWGGTTGTVKGIISSAPGTWINAVVDSNAIGNCDADYEFSELTVRNKISLISNPFTNGSGSFNTPLDFILNNIAGGGALCRATALPNSFDGAQVSWGDVGALQVEPPSVSSSGGFSKSRLFGAI